MHVLVCICSNVRQFFCMSRSLMIRLKSAISLPEGLLSVLAEPSFVNPKGICMVQYRKGAFSHNARTAPGIPVFILGTPLKTTHLQKHA